MTVFKTTQEILNNPWQEYPEDSAIPNIIPEKLEWHDIRNMNIDDVAIWEQIYYCPGDIGIYAAWNPFGELYMITYNLYIETDYGIETFYGPTAASEVRDRANALGINLELNKIWVDELNVWMYDDSRLTPF
jgi:hypothetical protein